MPPDLVRLKLRLSLGDEALRLDELLPPPFLIGLL